MRLNGASIGSGPAVADQRRAREVQRVRPARAVGRAGLPFLPHRPPARPPTRPPARPPSDSPLLSSMGGHGPLSGRSHLSGGPRARRGPPPVAHGPHGLPSFGAPQVLDLALTVAYTIEMAIRMVGPPRLLPARLVRRGINEHGAADRLGLAGGRGAVPRQRRQVAARLLPCASAPPALIRRALHVAYAMRCDARCASGAELPSVRPLSRGNLPRGAARGCIREHALGAFARVYMRACALQRSRRG